MHLRNRTTLLIGTLLILAVPGLSACSKTAASEREYTPAVGVNHRDAYVDVLNALIVSGQPGSGTFIATLVNNVPDASSSMTGLSGVVTANDLQAAEFAPIDIPARGLVNLANDQGIAVKGDFEAGEFVQIEITLGDGEVVAMRVPVVPNSGDFEGLDTSGDQEPTPADGAEGGTE
jgi:hypothetical protein